MKSRPITILLVIFIVIIVAILAFVLPEIIRQDEHLKANNLFDEGTTCEFKGDDACATDRYQQAIAMYGEDSRYYTYLAQIQIKQGNYSDAIKNYQKGIEIDPSNDTILPELNKAIGLQATQTAAYLPAPLESTPSVAIGTMTAVPPTPLPEAVYPIFDEEFGIIKSVATVSQSSDDNIKFEIVDDEAYSGKRSLLITWHKLPGDWASVLLGFDSDISNSKKAAAGQMASINLSPPADYAIQFFAKRAESSINGYDDTPMDDSITLKFQDQNLLIKNSIGNQAIYIYYGINAYLGTPVVDGRLELRKEGWQEFCLPLASFDTDYWIKKEYKRYAKEDIQIDWSNVKQINIDADVFSTDGGVYIDAMRIIRASDCVPSP